MKILFATSNEGKVKNARMSLAPFGIGVEQAAIDLIESRSEDPAVIALEKARQAFQKLKKLVIVEDSGFFIEALNGFPMTHVRFSLKTVGIKNIIKMMKGVKNRKAEWRMTLAYVYGKEQFKTFTFVETGEIAKSPRPVKRQMMSDYWRIYVPKMIPSNKLALCEMTEIALRDWHNYFAENNHFMKFGEWLSKNK